MAHRNIILQELHEMNSKLVNLDRHFLFQVPARYFDNLASDVMKKIRASEAASAQEELAFLSPVLNTVSRTGPYSVPGGYFENLGEKLGELIFAGNDQTAKEELESLSPLLLQLKDKPTYSVPTEYFEHLKEPNTVAVPVTKTKVISLASRKWFRYAAAVVVVGFVVAIGLKFLDKKETTDTSDKSFTWVQKNMKKVSTDEINEFVELANTASADIGKTGSKDDIINLLKDVSDKEIQEFLNDTQTAEPEPDDDLILN